MNFDVFVVDRSLFHLFNGWLGHWSLLDGLAAHVLANDLLKGGLLGACLMVAWCRTGTHEEVRRTRRIVLGSLLAATLALCVSKFLSHVIVLPRPYLREGHVFALDGKLLVRWRGLDCRPGLDNRSRERVAGLANGTIPPDDWGSFPSDHASFFVALSLALLAAWPAVGWVAMSWTVFVILGGKMLLGFHSPLEILGGALIAWVAWIAVLGLLQSTPGRWVDRCVDWCGRYPSWATALWFLVVFEITSTLTHVNEILVAAGKLL